MAVAVGVCRELNLWMIALGILVLLSLWIYTQNESFTRETRVNTLTVTEGHFYLCKLFVGRLGNQMFQYASLYGIAKSKGMVPIISASSAINDYFNLWAQKIPNASNVCMNMQRHYELRSSAYDPGTVSFLPSTDTRLIGYLQSFRYFEKYQEELRTQFKLPGYVVTKAKETLRSHLTRLSLNRSDVTLIAVHVRRGDRAHLTNFGMTMAPIEYIINAQKYFLNKYKNVVFVICSDTMNWCQENLPRSRSLFIKGQSLMMDLAVMTQCDHAIMTVGTLGWWMAWLVNGETIYYQKRFVPGSPLSRQWNMSDHYPPAWIAML